MADPFIAEIKMFAGTFAPRNYATCDGQLLNISQNSALFSLVGTTYGGDGQTTFALPDMRGRVPIHVGTGPGLTSRPLGQRSGAETALSSNVPAHSHTFKVPCNDEDGETDEPQGNFAAKAGGGETIYHSSSNAQMGQGTTDNSPAGGTAHNNMQPFIVITFIIALFGLFPSRS